MCYFIDAKRQLEIDEEKKKYFTNPKISEKDFKLFWPKAEKNHTITSKGTTIFTRRINLKSRWNTIRQTFIVRVGRELMVDCQHDWYDSGSKSGAEFCRKCSSHRYPHPFACHDCKKPNSCDEAPGWCQECIDKATQRPTVTYGVLPTGTNFGDQCRCVSILNGHENGCPFNR